MPAQIIEGRKLAEGIRREVAAKIKSLVAAGKRRPFLAVVLVGNDPASHIYVTYKERNCASVGIASKTYHLPEDTKQAELNRCLDDLNADPQVDGILVQLPLPGHLSKQDVLDRISPAKDVDGLTPFNQGLMAWNRPGLYSCTPLGVMELIRATGVTIEGKLATVVGTSLLVGSPLARLLTNADATVISMHSKSRDKAKLASLADILVVATGVHRLVDEAWVKPGAIVIDVGIHRVGDRIEGDVQFERVKDKAGFITPVPGGVGPMTRAMLVRNCLQAYEMHLKTEQKP